MVLDQMLIDVEKNKLKVGNVIGVSGIYYFTQNWYVSSLDDYSATLVGLDEKYKPFAIPKVINVETNLIQYYIISKQNKKIKINQSYINQFYKNRNLVKKARYGDIILIETVCGTQVPFYVLNYDPISGSHLVYEIHFSEFNCCNNSKSIILDLCRFKVVSSKELRRDIFEKSKKIQQSLQTSNYNELTRIDDIIEFQARMDYLADKSQKCEMQLRELEFLNNDALLFQTLDDILNQDKLMVDTNTKNTSDELFITDLIQNNIECLEGVDSNDKYEDEETIIFYFKTNENLFNFSDDECPDPAEEDVDLKNEETFGSMKEFLFEDNKIIFPLELEEQIEQIIEEGKSFEPSCEELPQQPEPNLEENVVDDFEKLEISDFEPIAVDEKGCSIM